MRRRSHRPLIAHSNSQKNLLIKEQNEKSNKRNLVLNLIINLILHTPNCSALLSPNANLVDEGVEFCEFSSGDEDSLLGESETESDLDNAHIDHPNSSNNITTNNQPFNRRKFPFFDEVTAQQRHQARALLKGFMRGGNDTNNRSFETNGMVGHDKKNNTDHYNEEDRFIEELQKQNISIAGLLLEALCINKKESLPGMSKCYEAIVTAGKALDQTSSNSTPNNSSSNNKTTNDSADESQILYLIKPVLIANLDYEAGQAFILLSKLRRQCRTMRYRRRFVNRIAPCLVRPSYGAVWSIKQQQDIPYITTVLEIILRHASDIFSDNWVQLGMRYRLNEVSSVNNTTGKSQVFSTNEIQIPKEIEEYLSQSICNTLDRQKIWNVLKKRNFPSGGGLLQSPGHKFSSKSLDLTSSDVLSLNLVRSSARSMDFNAPSERSKSPTPFHTSLSTIPLAPASPKSPKQMESVNYEVPKTPKNNGSSAPRSPNRSHRKSLTLQPISFESSTSSTSQLFIPPKSPTPHHHMVSPVIRKGSDPDHFSLSISNNDARSVASYGVQSSPGRSVMGMGSVANNFTKLSTHDRQRTVAACRALREQINEFEKNYLSTHQKKPKGANERAPLASTYSQYREWKRAIRFDAALKIQSYYRTYCTKKRIVELIPEMKTILVIRRQRLEDAKLSKLSLPLADESTPEGVEVVAPGFDMPSNAVSFNPPAISLTPTPSSAAMMKKSLRSSPVINHHQPHHSHRRGRKNSASSDISSASSNSSHSDLSVGSGGGERSPRSPVPSAPGISSSSVDISLVDLQAQKRELKSQLKSYDMQFMRTHGRMPVKAEKEPIRHLYEKYNSLKAQIAAKESSGMSHAQKSSSGSISSSSVGSHHSNYSSITPPGTPSQDMSALRAEKGTLHQMLRSYEKEFFEQHRRQVSCFEDIRPVAAQYRRYKEIKKAIAALQSQEQGR